MAVLPSFDAFFSSYCRKPPRGYSGTSIFTKKSTCVPIAAEEGLSGLLQQKMKIPESEQVGNYPAPSALSLSPSETKDLDLEGRATIVDLRLFVLINLYCPNQTNEARLVFKDNFNALLEARVSELIKTGRQVVVVGDINVCSQPIDHCEPEKRAKDHGLENFEDHPSRTWFNRWIGEDGPLTDVTRKFHPDRKYMYTCALRLFSFSSRRTFSLILVSRRLGDEDQCERVQLWHEARLHCEIDETEHDLQLVTDGLLPWIKDSNIQPEIHGSDHCPVYADFHDSITLPDGRFLNLWDEINPPSRSSDPAAPPSEAPRFAAKNYEAFSGKQRLLSRFFAKPKDGVAASGRLPSGSPSLTPMPESIKPDPTPTPEEEPGELSIGTAMKALQKVQAKDTWTNDSNSTGADDVGDTEQMVASTSQSTVPRSTASQPSTKDAKGKGKAKSSASESVSSKKSEAKKVKNGQSTLQGFFKPPPKPEKVAKKKKDKTAKGKAKSKEKSASPPATIVLMDDDDDYEAATVPSPPATAPASSSNGPSSTQNDELDERDDLIASATAVAEYNVEASAKWSALMAPKATPRYVRPRGLKVECRLADMLRTTWPADVRCTMSLRSSLRSARRDRTKIAGSGSALGAQTSPVQWSRASRC